MFFDTSSTYWEMRGADELGELDDEPADDQTADRCRDDGPSALLPSTARITVPDLPQVVIGMAVTRDGIPVRVWTFPGNTSDQEIIRKVKDDLRGWNLRRLIWVLDRGFTSERNRRYLQRGGGHYIVGEKLRRQQGSQRRARPPGPLPHR